MPPGSFEATWQNVFEPERAPSNWNVRHNLLVSTLWGLGTFDVRLAKPLQPYALVAFRGTSGRFFNVLAGADVNRDGNPHRVVRSYNALVPLFVYLFLHPKPTELSRVRMTAYFHNAQFFGWFGSQTDSTLNILTGIVQKAGSSDFPLDEIKKYFQERRLIRTELTEADLWDARLRPLFLNIVYSQTFGESPFDVSFKGNEPHIDHIYPQYMLRSKLGCGSREINDIGNLRFVGATDNIRKRGELPASYFCRLKASGVPIDRHLLVGEFALDPTRLLFDYVTFDRFCTERRERIW